MSPSLDDDQTEALRIFQEGKSIALLGGGGCGKSFLLREIISCAKQLHGVYPKVACCAFTNTAAAEVGGLTIHNLFCARPGWEFSKDGLIKLVEENSRRGEELRQIKVLIIDEVSRVKKNEIEAIDFVLRKLAVSEWHSSLPMGGRQLVLAGDPFQLQPYGVSDNQTRLQTAFESRVWFLCFRGHGSGVVAILTKNHRQDGDDTFFQILCRLRSGSANSMDINTLNKSSEGIAYPPDGHTKLCRTHNEVTDINSRFLSKLPGDTTTIVAHDWYRNPPNQELKKRLGLTAPDSAEVKLGAYVMLTRKVDCVQAGSRGVVAAINRGKRFFNCDEKISLIVRIDRNSNSEANVEVEVPYSSYEVYSFDCQILAERKQIPVISSYAMTISRSQGLSFDTVAVDFRSFHRWHLKGMAYVALSRCTKMSGLWVKGLEARYATVSSRAICLFKHVWALHTHFPARTIGIATPIDLGLGNAHVSSSLKNQGWETSKIIPAVSQVVQHTENRTDRGDVIYDTIPCQSVSSISGVSCFGMNKTYCADISSNTDQFRIMSRPIVRYVASSTSDFCVESAKDNIGEK